MSALCAGADAEREEGGVSTPLHLVSPYRCTRCDDLLYGAGLKIGRQTLCVWCGEEWTIPTYPARTSLRKIQEDRKREAERKKAA